MIFVKIANASLVRIRVGQKCVSNSQTQCVEPFSTRNPCLVLSLIPAMPHVGEVDSGIGPKVAFNEPAQGLRPCEEDTEVRMMVD